MGEVSMSVDVLQEKIRKTKNPSLVQFEAFASLVPDSMQDAEGSVLNGYRRLSMEVLQDLKGIVPGVRFGFGSFALWGEAGVQFLLELLQKAKNLGFYVLLDVPELTSAMAAEHAVKLLSGYPCDGYVIPAYPGSDLLRPFQQMCAEGKSVFPLVRTANRSASELQDLLSGGRLVHTAAADIVNRHSQAYFGKCGYSQIGAVAAASSADSLRTLRTKYSQLFLLLDGYDYPNSNAKNCSYAFDRLGHGAAACAGVSILGAWKDSTQDMEPVTAAVAAAERMKKNLTRYVTIL